MANIEQLATELAALSPGDREQVMQRLRVLGPPARSMAARITGARGSRTWADLIGETVYDTYGIGVAVVQNVRMKTVDESDRGHLRTVRYIKPGQTTVIEIFAYAIAEEDTRESSSRLNDRRRR